MNDNGSPKQPLDPTKDFNVKAKEPKTPNRSRARGEALQDEIVRKKDLKRPRPVRTLDYTPSGAVVNEIQKQGAAKKNADVDKEIAEYRQWIARTKGRTREEFNRETSGKEPK